MNEPAQRLGMLRADQRARWLRGDAVRVEAYLEREPLLRKDPEVVLDLIRNEMLLRQELGEGPGLAEYLERFRDLDPQIRWLFRLHQGLAGVPKTRLITTSEVLPPGSAGEDPNRGDEALPSVPGYEILAELGRGGMGVVYRARQSSLNRLVAIKMLLNGLHAGSTALARFRTEALAVSRLQHPNIVRIHEIGEFNGRPFLTLEYIEGGTLQEQDLGTPRPERESAQLLETISRAMHHAHQRGILHRDLKPTNILLTLDGSPRITDFGLAKLLDIAGGPTRTEAIIGTPSYMAPEQAAGNNRGIGVPADVYSLGAILYELLTGRVPFHGSTLLNTLEQVRNREPVPPRRLRGGIARDLETICLKCLEKDPRKRYESAGALADDLRRFLDGEPVVARPVGFPQRLWRMARRRPLLVAKGVGIAALVCLLATALWYFRVSGKLQDHRTNERERQFIQRRNQAFFHGLLTADPGALFTGGETNAGAKAAEEALALAGVEMNSDTVPLASSFPAWRKAEIAEDCYTLLLVLAGARAKQPSSQPVSPDRLREALRLLDRAARFGFHTRAYHLRRAEVLEQLGERTEARKHRDQGRSLAPEGALDHFLIGEERCRRGDWEEAIDSFDRVLALQPGHFWARFLLALCHLKLQDWETGRVGLNACLSQNPDFVWAYLFRSHANERLNEPGAAEADFAKALQLDPSPEARYVLFLLRGALRFKQEQLEQAGADFRSAIALKPKQYNAYLNLAQVYLAQKKFDEARELVGKAMQREPPARVIVDYQVDRGRNLYREKKYKDALAASEAALAIDANHPPAHDLRGRALLELGHDRQAEKAFDLYLLKGGAASPNVFRLRGQVRMRLGRYPEAAEDYTRVLERIPSGEIFRHRGWAHFFSDAWKLALRDFSRAIELAPRESDSYTGRGLARVMLGRYREAVTDADDALRLEPSSPAMMHNLACIFAQAATRVEADLEEQDRQALAKGYRKRAVEMVRKTLLLVPPGERLSFLENKILADKALFPIRGEAGLEKVRKEFAGSR